MDPYPSVNDAPVLSLADGISDTIRLTIDSSGIIESSSSVSAPLPVIRLNDADEVEGKCFEQISVHLSTSSATTTN